MAPRTISKRGVAIAAVALLLSTTWPLFAVAAAEPDPPMGLPGCNTTCGDVVVPYPFGIGPANCSLPGFNLTCDTTQGHPRLLLGDDRALQVAEIYLDENLVFVNHTGGISISGSDVLDGHGTLFPGLLRDDGPYRLPSYNELTVLSCNTQATLRNGNVTISGCFTFCEGEYGLSGRGCNGMGCCHAPIVTSRGQKIVYGASYDVQLKWFGPNNSVPVLVLVAMEGWFDEHFGSHNLIQDQHMVARMPVPVWLEWEVVGHGQRQPADRCTRGPRGGYLCTCNVGYEGNAYLSDGCKDINECDHPEQYTCFGQCNNTQGGFECRCPPGTQGDPFMPGGCVNSSTLTGSCKRLCGNMSVPYPFGIFQGTGPDHCYLPGFQLTCDTSHQAPRLLVRTDDLLRVTDFYLPNLMVRVVHSGSIINTTNSRHVFNFKIDGGHLLEPSEVPYSLSARNELILVGCNAKAMMYGDHGVKDIISGCASFCPDNITDTYVQEVRSCYGMGCCQARMSMSTNGMLPIYVDYEQIDNNHSPMPAYVFIAQEGWFDNQQSLSGKSQSVAAQDVPMLLQWEVLPSTLGLPRPDAKRHPNCTQEVIQKLCQSKNSYCKPGIRGYTCHCEESYDGNPYSPDHDGCKGGRRKPLTTGQYIAIGFAIGAGLILLVLVVFLIFKKLKHRRAKQLKWKFFEQNRGRLLQQLVSQRADIAEKMIISLEELEKATNNFDKSRELGGGGHGTVYKGILSDLHVVAIKKPKKVLQKEIDEFINEVAILSQINHRNVVKLYGCCLETEVPMLVYEFISNGTLYDHLHVAGPSSLSWDNRLRIATETAGSLSYLHSTASVPIIHRDVKSGNILLDDSLTAKVADFGASRYVPVDRSGVTTVVQGTIGYLDPMYFYNGRLTEKTDVYSFGVMLVELMTRKKPFSYLSSEGEGLVADFATLFAEGKLTHILDPQVMEEGGEKVEKVAALAVECIKLRGEDRPGMKQVESTLESLQSNKQQVQGAMAVDNQENGIEINYPSTADGRYKSTRCYSMEKEFMLSSKYPR